MKNTFVDKLNEFDFLIKDKENKVSELNEEISNKETQLKKLDEQIKELSSKDYSKKSSDVVLPRYADLEDGNLLSSYKKIKNSFNYNAKDVIKKLLAENDAKSNETYNKYKHIRDYFSFDVVYKISTYQPDKQRMIVNELLNNEERLLIKNLNLKGKFNIRTFLEVLDRRILEYNPEIKVYVGDKKENYDNINENVKTIVTKDIAEGFKIEYKGIIYDYSI